jgi:hypothetical protein
MCHDPTTWTAVIERAFFARLLTLLGSRATDWPQPVDRGGLPQQPAV